MAPTPINLANPLPTFTAPLVTACFVELAVLVAVAVLTCVVIVLLKELDSDLALVVPAVWLGVDVVVVVVLAAVVVVA